MATEMATEKELNKRNISEFSLDMSRSFSEVVQSSKKKANYGENADHVAQESPVRASASNTRCIPSSHDPTHPTLQASPEQGLYPPQQYLIGGPITISSQDILKIAEAVKFALKDEIDKLV
jgi:hypothetical protein